MSKSKYPATYIGSYRKQYFDEDILYMYYKYRGHEYEVAIDYGHKNESLRNQHAYEQARIDRIIELEEQDKHREPQKPTIDECMKELMDYSNS